MTVQGRETEVAWAYRRILELEAELCALNGSRPAEAYAGEGRHIMREAKRREAA